MRKKARPCRGRQGKALCPCERDRLAKIAEYLRAGLTDLWKGLPLAQVKRDLLLVQLTQPELAKGLCVYERRIDGSLGPVKWFKNPVIAEDGFEVGVVFPAQGIGVMVH